MIVDCACYCDGERQGGRLTVAEAASIARKAAVDPTDARFVWLGLHEPTDDEFAEVVATFGLDASAVQHAARRHQRPKLQVFSEEDSGHPTTVLLVLKPAWYVDSVEVVELGQLVLFVTHAVLSVRHGASGPLTGARERLEQDADRLRRGPTAVVATVLQHIVDEYVQVIVDLETDVDELEDHVFDGARADHGERIFNLKREVLDFRRAVDPLDRPLRELARGEVPILDPEERRRFAHQLEDLTRVSEHLQNLDALLDGALAANVASVGMRQNEDMRKISAGAAIITVPTLIAGIYGMNFDDMPELHWATELLALTMMAAAALVLYWQFKKRNWL